MRRLLVLLAALGVVAGCSTSVPGTPTPEVAPADASPGISGLNLPPRPRELKLDGRDPCASLTPTQLAELNLKMRGPSLPTDPAGPTGSFCTGNGFDSRAVSVAIAYLANRGIESAIKNPEAHPGDIKPSRIAEFPSILTIRPEVNSCVADIDVAPTQLIDIEYADLSNPPTLSPEQLCQGAAAIGEGVVATLLNS